MPHQPLRIGLVGAGANTRKRHIPGLKAIPDVHVVAVCNRRTASTNAVAREYGIPHIFTRWQELVASPEIDAVVVGTWPYLHCPVTLAALQAGKHVLTEARLSLDAAEAHRMLAAARRHPDLVTQVVPSPYGLRGHTVMQELLDAGRLGNLQEVYVYSLTGALADPAAPLSWRQDAALSGYNMLTLGIIHETLLRWLPRPVRVMAQVHAFIPSRIDPESGVRRVVGTPDSVQALAILQNGARAIYQFSGVTAGDGGMGVWLYGSKGIVHYDFTNDRIRASAPSGGELQEIPIPPDKAMTWRVEEEFVEAIRHRTPVRFTDFETAVGYMEFTEAVARSAQRGEAVDLPLEEFQEEEPE